MVTRWKLPASAQPSLQLQVRCYPSDDGSDSSAITGAPAGVPSAGPGRAKFSRSTSRASDCGRKSLRERAKNSAIQRLAAAAAAYKQLITRKPHSEDSSLHDSSAVLQPRRNSSSNSAFECGEITAHNHTTETAGAALEAYGESSLEQGPSWDSSVQKAKSSSSSSSKFCLTVCCLKSQCNEDSNSQQPLAPDTSPHTASTPDLGTVVAAQQSVTAACAEHAVQAACRGSSSRFHCGDSISASSVVVDGIVNAPVVALVKPTSECVRVKVST
jgi:hypothetical protein